MKIDWDIRSIETSLFWIPLLPFLGALALGTLGRKLSKQSVSIIACGSVAGSAILSSMILIPMAIPAMMARMPAFFIGNNLGTWFKAGALTVNASFLVDHLNSVLLLVVSGVGFLIHVYSTEYMKDDEAYWRFFTYLNLFVGFMLVLVLANNLVLLFVGWEGVGLCSYLLIGFWYTDDQKAYAGRKAFVVNRIGDFGFVLGLFVLFSLFGTLEIQPLPRTEGTTLFNAIQELSRSFNPGALVPSGVLAGLGFTYGGALTLGCLLLFVGATGKSAQFPLYVWLPDAMAGPTPVSALIHAATMVTAGVYMIARLGFVFALSPTAMVVVASVGAFTALFAALMGFAQNDIKKVLAYSTVSQLGFMVIGVGIGAWWQAVFHLVTHAFFKACLFLGAGSVILGCHHEQDIRKMGGLWKKMPATAWTFLIATVAITGILPFSGFWSKDAILHAAHGADLMGLHWFGPLIYYVGSAAALGTAFYMFRLFFLTFLGQPRSHEAEHAHESGPAVTYPLAILALLSMVGAVWGVPWFGPNAPGSEERIPQFEHLTAPVFRLGQQILGERVEHGGLVGALVVAFVIALVGVLLAYFLYVRGGIAKLAPMFESGLGKGVYQVVANKFYVDELYDLVVVRPFRFLAHWTWKLIDVGLIDKAAVNGTAQVAGWTGQVLRVLQNGDVQRYAAVMAIGVAAVVWALVM